MPEGETGPPLAVGTVVAERFRIVGRVGEGGMGEVYIADQLGMDRRVALKLVRPSLAGDEAMLDRFRREARAASRIKSRNVVTVYDFGRDTTTGRLFIAMELLEGETLASRIERAGAIGTVEALRITAEVCLALDAAHRAGVVHRDLKPENVFVEHDGNVKVLDFGIARILDPGGGEGSSKATITATFVGTPAYISPEAAARNKSRPVGPASDLYSLGVMLFEMLTGRLPFDDDEPMILIGMHLRAPPERLSDVLGAGAVPDALDVLVDDLLAKEPESRPDGARAVIDRLRVTSDSIDAALPRPSQADTTGDQRPFAPAQLPSSTPGPGDLEPSSRVPTPQPMELSGSHTAARARLPRAQVAAAAIGAASLLLATGVAVAIWATGVGSHSAPVAERPVAQPPVEPPPTTMSPAPSPLPPATTIEPAPTRTVRISFEVSPRTARVEVDGTRVTGSTLELPGNGSTHRAVAISGARRSPDVEFVADADRVVRLVVRRRGRAASHEPPPTESTAASSRRGGLLGLIHDEE